MRRSSSSYLTSTSVSGQIISRPLEDMLNSESHYTLPVVDRVTPLEATSSWAGVNMHKVKPSDADRIARWLVAM